MINYDKKRELDDYDTFTCLKFPKEHQLFLKKMQTAFNWYINMFLDNGAASHYRKLVKMIKLMNENEWNRFDFSSIDAEVSQKMRRQGIVHYSKFMNRGLAVKFPSKHLPQNVD